MKFHFILIVILLLSVIPERVNSRLPILEQMMCSNDLPTKPIKKKKNKKIKQRIKVKQEQREDRKRARQAKKKTKKSVFNFSPPKTKERKDWNRWLTLGLFSLGVFIIGPLFLFYFISVGFSLALGGGPEIWSLLFLVLAIIFAIAVLLGFILGIALTIKGLQKLAKESKPIDGKFDWALFWGVMSTILIPMIYISLFILLLALSPGTILTWVIIGIVTAFFATAIAGLLVSLKKLRKRALQSDES